MISKFVKANPLFSLDDELLPLDEHSVDALVADSDPLDFGGSVYSGRSGTTTPAPPPGFGHSHPPTAYVQFGENNPVNPATASHSPIIARPTQPAVPRPITPVTPLIPVAGLRRAAKVEAVPDSSDAKKTIKDLAVASGLASDIASQQSRSLKEEDFPALDSVKGNSPTKVTPALPSKPAASAKSAQGKRAAPETPSKSSASKAATPATSKTDKRPAPGILDIAAATKSLSQAKETGSSAESKGATNTPISSAAAVKSVTSSALPTPTPTTASVASPLARAAPKTLRLVQTPKAEPENIIPAAAVSSIRAAASAAAGHRPGTPASEIISDTASVISASVSASRTSSPPPSKIGSAALRTQTKSQQRKQRKEASKEAAATMADTKPVEQPVEVAPIEGRKKKQKKEKKQRVSRTASPAISRPETPVADSSKIDTKLDVLAEKVDAVDGKLAQKGKGSKNQSEPELPAKGKEGKTREAKEPPKSPPTIDTSIRLNESTKTTVLTPNYVPPSVEPRAEPTFDGAVGEIPSLAEILQSLIDEGELPDPDDVNMFRPLPNYRAEAEKLSTSSLPPTVKSVVTKDDEAVLNAFREVHKEVNGHRVLLTPNGDFVLNLSEEEEARFLDLQKRIARSSGEAGAFMAPKYTPGTGFSLIKGRAVPNGMPSFFPQGPSAFPSDPIGKMHREEAIGCINQHVLPSLNLGSYKTNSSFNANSVNLQSLAPWISGAGATADGKRGTKGPANMFGAGVGDGAWDDIDDLDGETSGPSPAIGSTPLMSVEEAESVLAQAKKQHEATDKKFKQSMTKIRRQFGLH
ncbi:hypothetical protein JX265_000952 [Neoarthrinium moseri]|uniref:Uncharacterized protein n=1 Tax=Neoarthrinium moseri TaxID=1658444 RepID=A0A9P9WWS1_9PEZI|nr:hypothetical protein JX265_000952 [Neoarthrinium moseri]